MNLWIWRERRASMPSVIIHSTRVRGSRVAFSVVRRGLGFLVKAGERRIPATRLGDEG
jgi:hypothetical protein